MPAERALKVVTETTKAKAAKAKALTVTQAADKGTERELLVAMRTRLARSVEDPNAPAPALAALSRQLLMVDKEIRILDADEGGDDVGNATDTPDEAWTAT